MKNIIFFVLISQSSLLFAMGHSYKVVNTGSVCGLAGPIADKNALPNYKLSSCIEIPALGQGSYFFQIEEYLFNELLEFMPSAQLEGWGQGERSINGQYKFGALVDAGSLESSSVYHETTLSHIVMEPLVSMKIGAETMELSMGTCIEVWGELNGNFGVPLPRGRGGWIPKNSVQSLTELERMREEKRREQILVQARKLVGQPYKWGGRSAFAGHGYDCSGFLKTVFSTCGKKLPRPVEWQRQMAQIISADRLLPGDVLFTLKNGQTAVHVVIWAGNNRILEASPESMTVREASVEQVFGKSFNEIKNGEIFYSDNNGNYSVVFGRFI